MFAGKCALDPLEKLRVTRTDTNVLHNYLNYKKGVLK